MVAREAGNRGLANVRTRRGVAEKLPFEDASFDIVLSRFSAHHWQDMEMALREAARVLKPGGVAGFVELDLAGPAAARHLLPDDRDAEGLLARAQLHARGMGNGNGARRPDLALGKAVPPAPRILLLGGEDAHAPGAGGRDPGPADIGLEDGNRLFRDRGRTAASRSISASSMPRGAGFPGAENAPGPGGWPPRPGRRRAGGEDGAAQLKTTVLWPFSMTRHSRWVLTARASTRASMSRPTATKSSADMACVTRSVSCSMIGPSSRSGVT